MCHPKVNLSRFPKVTLVGFLLSAPPAEEVIQLLVCYQGCLGLKCLGSCSRACILKVKALILLVRLCIVNILISIYILRLSDEKMLYVSTRRNIWSPSKGGNTKGQMMSWYSNMQMHSDNSVITELENILGEWIF